MASSDRKLGWIVRVAMAVALTFATLQMVAEPNDRQSAASAAQVGTPTRTPIPSATGTATGTPLPTGTPVPAATPATDPDYFPETGFSIGAQFREFFHSHGGLGTFGPPISNAFRLEGSIVQLFRNHALQQDQDGSVDTLELLPLLGPGDQPLRVAGATLPTVDAQLADSAPSPGAPDFAVQAREFVRANAPDQFYQAFLGAANPQDATQATPAEPTRLHDLAFQVWGLPVSRPTPDPNNPRMTHLRWEGGVMQRDQGTGQVQAVPLGAHFKTILTGENLPQDLAADVQASPYYRQYSPGSSGGVARPADLPDTVLSGAFQPSSRTAAAPAPGTTGEPDSTVEEPAPTPTPTPTSTADICTGDEEITYAPESPRVGGELVIAVTSASPHPHGRLLGTERTTFVREREGQRGKVWEWTVDPTYKGRHRYTFYVDSTIPCKSISLEVRAALSNENTNTNTNTNTNDNGNGNSNTNDNDNGNSNDNSSDNDAPRIRDIRVAARSRDADIRWTTDEASDSEVEYRGGNSGTFTAFDAAQVVSHSVRLTELQPSTTYRYRVRSTDAAGNLASSDELSFTTAAP